MADADVDLGVVWDEYCDGLRLLGRAALAEDRDGATGGAERLRHLARMVAMTLVQQIDFMDPAVPRLFRSNDDTWQWGGPNADNVYLGAAVEAGGTYRLTGDISSQPGAILQILGQPSAEDPIAVRVDRSLEEIADTDGRIDLLLGPDVDEAAGIALPADARRLVLREYVPSPATRRAGFVIERVDEVAEPAVLDDARMARALRSSQRWLERSIAFWDDYTSRRRAQVGDNRIEAPASGEAMGSDTIVYSAGFFSLPPHECLLVTLEKPQARYWALQLYTLGCYEAIDPHVRQSSLNHTQSHIDDDGFVRFIVSSTDPRVPNWLDTAGHAEGMMHLRAVWCEAAPTVNTQVVTNANLRDHLPSNHPIVTPSLRAEALRERRRFAQQKFVR